jgi:hypothetical protein
MNATATLDPPATAITGPCYYRWFASYEIPFRPVDPVAFADTEGLYGYYAAYHDLAGRVVRFDSIHLVRVTKEPWTPAPSVACKPGVAVYFTAVPGPSGGQRELGEQIEYAETEQCGEFFAGSIDSSTRTGTFALLRREVAFTDTYTYWPNGRMRSRVKSGPDQKSVSEYYDARGKQIDEQDSARSKEPEAQTK